MLGNADGSLECLLFIIWWVFIENLMKRDKLKQKVLLIEYMTTRRSKCKRMT